MNCSSTSAGATTLASNLRQSVAPGVSREDVIRTMRMSGLSQIACIKSLRDLYGLSLSDAKEAVHYSNAWADRLESNEVLHDEAAEAARDVGFIEVAS